jgi:S1-C subfamily serine protease
MLALLVSAAAATAAAQSVNIAPLQARSMVVRIRSLWLPGPSGGDARFPENGAGVIVGMEPGGVVIATAAHVVAEAIMNNDLPYDAADSIWVEFHQRGESRDSVLATLVFVDMARDVAGLRVPVPAARRAELIAMTFDWLGDPRAMKVGDAVFPMGCPNDDCWRVLPGDGLLSNLPGAIRFQTMSVGPGSSGGALFNSHWEVVGIVLDHKPPLATAIPIQNVVTMFDSASVPVQLRPPTVPRAGYHISVEATFLEPLSVPAVADSLASDAKQPGARITFTTRGRGPLTWRLTALRLAPYNTTVTALLGGVGFTLRRDRLIVQPYVEIGMGRADARYDRGGYHVAASQAGGARYVPLWTLARRDAIGIGGGLGVEYVIIPHVSIAATVARWSFGLPPNAPEFPGLFAGGGLRWSR